ncbi:hypothetical protein [Spirosoma endophyticum]|uniref:Uncharacterized protein n=1 Tax=Spirosoma endophyticum TaxID=662367 RepID=A0A1I2IBN2_9BACT|nr:hypothetical protein [Spirosoma endophyticum]SFF39644.1 hypothetical protein SAMN05216167_1654 [Spirosoma endophyticum]
MSTNVGTLDVGLTYPEWHYVTPYHYAQLCGLTRQAIYNRIIKGTLPVVRLKGPRGEPIGYIDTEAFPPGRKPWGGGRPRKA